jgi:hypothetical protein
VCTADDVHVLYVDEIDRGQLLGYRLPVPQALKGRIELRITLAYSTPVEPTQPTEYTQSSLEVAMRPHALRYGYGEPNGTKRQVEDITTQAAAQLRAQGWRESQDPVSRQLKAAGKAENDLRDAGKWETMRHFRLVFKPGDIYAPRLDVSYLARRAGQLQGTAPTIPFAVLVTVIDRDSAGTNFDSAVAEFGALRVIPDVRSRVRVRSRAQGRNDSVWF